MSDKQVILVVDDNPENIDVLVGILKGPYKIKAATSGEKALKAIHKTPPDLILLDIVMPEMDGFQVLQNLKQDSATKEIPVVFVTGMNEPGEQERGLKMGAAGYLSKPVNPDDVLQLVHQIFEKT